MQTQLRRLYRDLLELPMTPATASRRDQLARTIWYEQQAVDALRNIFGAGFLWVVGIVLMNVAMSKRLGWWVAVASAMLVVTTVCSMLVMLTLWKRDETRGTVLPSSTLEIGR